MASPQSNSNKNVKDDALSVDQAKLPIIEQVLGGGGEMGALMRALDWSRTLLGPVETWPQSLRTALSILLNSGYPMYIAWGPQFVQFYNDAYRPILGSTKHPEALGRSTYQTFSEIWDFIGPMFLEVMRKGTASTYVDQLLALDRHGYVEECYFTFSYSAILNEDAVAGVFVTVLETTERVLRERRLQTLRALSDVSARGDVAEICAAVAPILYQNQYDLPCLLLYPMDKSDHTPLPVVEYPAGLLSELYPDWAAAPWSDESVANEGQPFRLREPIFPDGSVWPEPVTEAVCVPILPVGHERPSAFLVAGLSPRLAFDAPYQDFIHAVAANIAVIIGEAEAYEIERKRAEVLAELDRAKTAFFANISHEFRTPLTLLLGPLEDILAQPSLPPENREQLEMVHRNSLRLLKLVNTLLDFSRLEAGRLEAVYEPTDLAALTTDLVSVFRSAIERAGLQLIINCPPLPEPVYVDREMWEKIVFNLLSNAFKFTFEGEIEVTLQQAGRAAELSVRDTGTGIPAGEIPHLFERFHRGKGARARTYEGTGIGLALVQELAGLHSGSVRVESEVERGSTFTVAIPLGKDHLPADRVGATRTFTSTGLKGEVYVEETLRWLPAEVTAREQRAEVQTPLAAAPPATAQSALILLADDNADMRDYVTHLLSPQYRVEAVANGLAALAAARENVPDLVLSDVMMPGLDGFELLRQLRAEQQTREVPVILLSARAGEEARVEGLAAGADDYLVKPFSARELLARVETHLRMSQVHREAAGRERTLRVEMQQAKERLEQILAGIKDDFVMYDQDWRYVYVNDQAAQTLGYPKEQLLGQRIWDLFPDAIGNLFYQKMHQARDEGREIAFEHYYPPFDKWFENRAYPIEDGLLLFTTDITERKQAEEALRESEAAARQEIVARQQVEEQLRLLVHEKEVLLREVHHRVKNNLQAISNLLYLQSAYIKEEPVRQILRESQNRIKSIALIHEKLYQSKDLARLNFDEYIRSLINQLIDSYVANTQTIELKVQVEDVGLDVDTVVTLGIIISELVSNSLKHAFPVDAGRAAGRVNEIQIELRTDGDSRLLLIVGDNGVGLPENVNLTSSPSLGLHLVGMLTGHMGGTVEIERNEGTTFRLKFPRPLGKL